MWRKDKIQFRGALLALLVVSGLLASMLLVACGSNLPTPGGVTTNAAGTAQTASTAIASGANAASTVVVGGAQTAGTAVSGALTQVPTMPTATPISVTAPAASITPGAVPTYPDAQPVTFSQTERDSVMPGAFILNTLVERPMVNFYQLNGVSDNEKVKNFYDQELASQGWYNPTDQISSLFPQQANLSFLGNKIAFYTKDTHLFLLAVSGPLSASSIQNASLGHKFKVGDIAIMTLTGVSKVKL